jgi:quinol monooxygenase YgiN
MTVTKIIRYTTKPECAAENERLIRAVFAELAQDDPGGLRYAAFRLEDKVSFVHVAVLDDDGDANPLTSSAAFAEFQRGIGGRCAEGPAAADADLIGSYRLPLPASGEPNP